MKHPQHAAYLLIKFMVLLVLLAGPARAADEPAIIKALYDTYEEIAGDRPKHESIDVASDGTITLMGVHIVLSAHQAEGIDIRQDFKIGTVTLSDIKELEDGLFEVGKVSMKQANSTAGTPTETVAEAIIPVFEMEGMIVRGPARLKSPLDRWLATQILARSATMPLLTVKVADFSVDAHDMAYNWKGDAATGLGEWTFTVGSLIIPEEITAAGEGPASLKELGYDKLDIGAAGKSSIGLTGDLIDVGFEFGLILKKMATVTFGVDLGGIQQQLIQMAQALQAAPDDIDFNQFMALAQTVTINHMKLRIDDHSLVNRLIDQQVRERGKTREEIIAEAVQTGEFGLMGVSTPELAAQTKKALQDFLNNPGWIQIEVKPTAPVSIAKLLELAGAPPEAEKLLNIQVTSGPPAE